MLDVVKIIWHFAKYEIPEFMSEWRLVPRLLIALYGYVFYMTVNWFMATPDPNMAQAGFVSTVVGAGAAWFGLYVNSQGGKKFQNEKTDKPAEVKK